MLDIIIFIILMNFIKTSEFMIKLTSNPHVLLGIIIIFLLFVGTLVEVVAAAIILIPVLFPLGDLFQYNEIHYAVIIVITLAMGCITPPVGILIFITTGIAKTTVVETSKYIWPYLIIVFLMIFICAIFPKTITFIPDLFWHQ